MIAIKNNGQADFIDRCDGQEYIFPAGKTVVVSEDVARHFFGFRVEYVMQNVNGEMVQRPVIRREPYEAEAKALRAGWTSYPYMGHDGKVLRSKDRKKEFEMQFTASFAKMKYELEEATVGK